MKQVDTSAVNKDDWVDSLETIIRRRQEQLVTRAPLIRMYSAKFVPDLKAD